MIKQIITGFLLCLIFIGCCSQKKLKNSNNLVTQGIAGQVFEVAGNVMPSPDEPQHNFEGIPMKATVAVFALLKHESLQKKEGMYINMESTAIAQTETNEKGEFKIALPVGSYSVFLKMKEGYYANSFDEKMNVNPVTIKKDSLTILKIKFDLHAVH